MLEELNVCANMNSSANVRIGSSQSELAILRPGRWRSYKSGIPRRAHDRHLFPALLRTDRKVWTDRHSDPKGSDRHQYMVAGRDGLGFAVNDQRKNRRSHLSQRNGLTKIRARTLSRIPLRLDRWRRSLVHCGQFTKSMLLTLSDKLALALLSRTVDSIAVHF